MSCNEAIIRRSALRLIAVAPLAMLVRPALASAPGIGAPAGDQLGDALEEVAQAVLALPHQPRSKRPPVPTAVGRVPCVLLGAGERPMRAVLQAMGCTPPATLDLRARHATFSHPSGVDLEAGLVPFAYEAQPVAQVTDAPAPLLRAAEAILRLGGDQPWVFLGRSGAAVRLLGDLLGDHAPTTPVVLQVRGVVFRAVLPFAGEDGA